MSSELLLADIKFLFGWFALAWVLTFIELEFWRKPPWKGLPDIQAWSLTGLLGIFFAPFVHRSWGHLKSNTLPFFILGGLVILRHPIDFILITITIALGRGILGWFLGRIAFLTPQGRIVNVGSAGLSSVIYGYAGFLIALFYFDRTIASAILLVFVLWRYGRGYRGMVPSARIIRARIGWDGHLYGFIVGAFVAAYLEDLRPVSIALLQALNLPTQFAGIQIGGVLINETFYRQGLPNLIAQYSPVFWSRLRVVLQLVAVAWITALVDLQILGGSLRANFGIRPWTLKGLIGIPSAPFLHGDWEHIASNTVAFLIFGGLLVLVNPNDFLLISSAIALISGSLIWFSAFSLKSGYVGASAVIFGYLGFLLSLYYFENNLTAALLLAGTLLLIVLYDRNQRRGSPSLIQGVLPRTFDASWGHFLGFISGVIVAGYLPSLRSYAAYLARNFNF
jgi:membrane associated rhomboid family serine protease